MKIRAASVALVTIAFGGVAACSRSTPSSSDSVISHDGSDAAAAGDAELHEAIEELADEGGGVAGARRNAEGPGLDAAATARLERRLAKLDPDDDIRCYALLGSYGAAAPIRDPGAVGRLAEILIALAAHDTPSIRAAAIGVLARLPSEHTSRAPFELWLTDLSPAVRRQAVLASVRRADQKLKERTTVLVRDPDPRVRRAVATALRGVPTDAAAAAVATLFLDTNSDVVREVTPAIAALPAPPVAMLLDATRNPNPVIRTCAATALGDLSRPGTYETLVAVLGDPAWEPRVAAMRALVRLPEERLPDVMTLLLAIGADTARKRTDRFEAIQCLAECVTVPDLEVLSGIAAADKDHAVRLAAARTLLVHCDPRGIRPLVSLLSAEIDERNDEEDRDFVRLTADATLREIVGHEVELTERPDWARAIPALERIVADPGFHYQADRLAEFW